MPHREVVSQADFSGLKVSNQSLGASIGEQARISLSKFKVQEPAPDPIRGSRACPRLDRGFNVPSPNSEHGTRNPERRTTAVKYLGFVAHVLLSAIVLASLGCAKSAQPQARPPDVAVVKVEQKDVPIWREWIGTLDGLVNAQIKPQVTGYLLRQNYTDGAFVKKGQLLFEIDPRTFQAAVDQAKGQLANAEGQVAQAQANEVKTQQDVTRYTPLAKEQAIARSKRQRRRSHPRGSTSALPKSSRSLTALQRSPRHRSATLSAPAFCSPWYPRLILSRSTSL